MSILCHGSLRCFSNKAITDGARLNAWQQHDEEYKVPREQDNTGWGARFVTRNRGHWNWVVFGRMSGISKSLDSLESPRTTLLW